MPERELWPAGPGSDAVTRVGSWDSMASTASTRSGSSDSSYDFLSAEEKECLLFLEETIGSLDTEVDSGLSPAESERVATPRGPRALLTTLPVPWGHPEGTVVQQGPEPRRGTPSGLSYPPEPQGLALRSGSYSLPRNIHISRNQNLRKSAVQPKSHNLEASEGLVPEPEQEPVSRSGVPGQPPASPRKATLDLDTLFPPPEAFRDPRQSSGEAHLPRGPRQQRHTPQLHTSLSHQKRQETSSEAMSQTANEKGSAGEPGQPQPPPAALSQDSRAGDAPLPAGRDPSAGPAPLAAPKPRKLPPNIVLKSSRSSFHSDPHSWLPRHPEAAPGDAGPAASSLQEQRKARREALEKLGLPQDQDAPSLHLGKPSSSARLRDTRAPAASPAAARALAPAAAPPASPAPALAAAPTAGKAAAPAPAWAPSPRKASAQGDSPSRVLTPAQEPSPGKVPAVKSMPVPIPKAPGVNSPLTQPKPDAGLTLRESTVPGLRQMNFKSNTLERSGVGLGSYLSAEKDPSPQTSTSLGKGSFPNKIAPNILRNSRPRPASLGTGKDFAGIQVGKLADLEQEQRYKHLSYQGQSRDKLPRPPCVSVKISPKGVPDEHRREALKKLGLLKE
ncbi:specifically androgen-regulated gene protein [Manis javanica]|uniref:specifically androgen-regulated gene protein n=1 Tax=Manis javanica TaxID=9974 RepID=UPI003C6D5A7E